MVTIFTRAFYIGFSLGVERGDEEETRFDIKRRTVRLIIVRKVARIIPINKLIGSLFSTVAIIRN